MQVPEVCEPYVMARLDDAAAWTTLPVAPTFMPVGGGSNVIVWLPWLTATTDRG